MAQRSTSHMVGATLIGGIAGAGLALLFAPRSGKETRQKIQENVDNLKEEASDKLSKAGQAFSRTGRKAKAELETLRDTNNRKTRKQSPVLSAWEEEV